MLWKVDGVHGQLDTSEILMNSKTDQQKLWDMKPQEQNDRNE
jgi:hypothetical protein